jgi:hypothetical protein
MITMHDACWLLWCYISNDDQSQSVLATTTNPKPQVKASKYDDQDAPDDGGNSCACILLVANKELLNIMQHAYGLQRICTDY